jgi:hypothetical protein
MSSRLALRVLCGALAAMALANAPRAVGPDTAKWLGALLLAGVIGTLAALALRRRRPKTSRGRTTRDLRKGNLVATTTR